jgi:hypothetical protein
MTLYENQKSESMNEGDEFHLRACTPDRILAVHLHPMPYSFRLSGNCRETPPDMAAVQLLVKQSR